MHVPTSCAVAQKFVFMLIRADFHIKLIAKSFFVKRKRLIVVFPLNHIFILMEPYLYMQIFATTFLVLLTTCFCDSIQTNKINKFTVISHYGKPIVQISNSSKQATQLTVAYFRLAYRSS